MDTDKRTVEDISIEAGRETDALVHSALGRDGDPGHYSTDIYIAIKVAAEKGWALIPVEVYKNRHFWNTPGPGHDHDSIWWAVVSVRGNVSMYRPVQDWIAEWGDWLDTVDENISSRHLGTTIPLAVSKCVLLAEKGWGP